MAHPTTRPAHRRRRDWGVAAAVALVVVAVGVALTARWPAVGVWVLFLGAVAAHVAGRRASDVAVLCSLGAAPLAQVAQIPARVAPHSETPIADVARIRAAGSGLVLGRDGARVLAAARLERLDVDRLLSGRWDRIAVPATELDGALRADHLPRLPHDGEAWVVRTTLGLLVLTDEVLRAAAAAARHGDGARRAGGGHRRAGRSHPGPSPEAGRTAAGAHR